MDRLFTLLSNLDTGPSHRSTDQQAKPEMLVQSTHLGKVRRRSHTGVWVYVCVWAGGGGVVTGRHARSRQCIWLDCCVCS
jgi:hypothetical protein